MMTARISSGPLSQAMPSPNPSYDPDWKNLHDYHAGARDEALAQRRTLIAHKADEAAFESLEAVIARHHAACLAAAKRQYRTLQEYAAALFRTLDRGAIDRAGLVLLTGHFDALRSIAAVDEAWEQVVETVAQLAATQPGGLPGGQPRGLAAFAQPQAASFSQFYRWFSHKEFAGVGCEWIEGCRVKLSVDERRDGWHVCFSGDGDERGPNGFGFDLLAAIVYREHVLQAKVTVGLDRFHFYQHTPAHGEVAEEFARIRLGYFGGGRLRAARWTRLEAVPVALQMARFRIAQDLQAERG